MSCLQAARRTERQARRFFTGAQRVLEYTVAMFLLAFAVVTLVNTAQEALVTVQRARDLTLAVTQGVDAALFVMILLEVLKTMLSRAPAVQRLQEFLVIGIFSAVRYGLEIVASAQGSRVAAEAGMPSAVSHGVVTDLTLNALGILVLVLALWGVRRLLAAEQPRAERVDPDPGY